MLYQTVSKQIMGFFVNNMLQQWEANGVPVSWELSEQHFSHDLTHFLIGTEADEEGLTLAAENYLFEGGNLGSISGFWEVAVDLSLDTDKPVTLKRATEIYGKVLAIGPHTIVD